MARAPTTFKQQDVTRALKATAAAGLEVTQVEITKDGKIVLVTGKSGTEPTGAGLETLNEWDGAR